MTEADSQTSADSGIVLLDDAVLDAVAAGDKKTTKPKPEPKVYLTVTLEGALISSY